MDLVCPRCKLPVSRLRGQAPETNFCPRCGKKIKEPPPPESIGEQLIVYAASFFVPPLGLWYGYKYLRYGGKTGKKIGYAAVILTLVSLMLAIWLSEYLINSASQSLPGLNF